MPEATPSFEIRPARSWFDFDWREIWEHRGLLGFFVWRGLRIRYRRTLLGVAWAIIPPVALMATFTLVFGRVVRIHSEGLPYPVFYFTALVPWLYVSRSVSDAMSALVAHQALINRVYFSRVILPFAAVLSNLADLLFSFAVLAAMLLLYDFAPSWRLLWLPVLVVLAASAAFGLGLLMAAFNARYRDVRLAAPSLIRLWMFASPVVYPRSLVNARWRWLYDLNPMSGLIEGFRYALTGAGAPPGHALLIAFSVSAALLVSGFLLFHRVEGELADVV